MAIVDDIRKDRRTKNVLDQTNTKTVSAPPASTGLTGDSVPAEVFTASDFDLVKNQVHLAEENFQLLEALNVMGQISNMQSQSGPMPGTMKLVDATGDTSASKFVLFQPDAGQVWQLIALDFDITGGTGNTTVITYLSDGSDTVKLYEATTSSTSLVVSDDIDAPIYVTSDCYLEGIWARTSGTSGNFTAAVVRVR